MAKASKNANTNPAVEQAIDAVTAQPETTAPQLSLVGGSGDLEPPPSEPAVPSPIPTPPPFAPVSPQEHNVRREHQRAVNRQDARSEVRTPTTRSLGEIQKLLPGVERLKIYKRMDNGNLNYIDEYSFKALRDSGSIESFIARHLRPYKGGGEYVLYGVDSRGIDIYAGTVPMSEPLTPVSTGLPAGPQPTDRMLEMTRDIYEDRIRELREQSSHSPDSFEQLMKFQRLMWEQEQRIEQRRPQMVSSGDSGLGAAIAAGLQTLGQLFTSQQQQFQTMMQELRRPSPLEDAMVKKLLEPPPPPPPMLPPSAPEASPLDQLAKLGEIIANFTKKNEPDPYLQMLLADRLTPRDMMSMMQNKEGTDDFRKAAENMNVLVTMFQTIKSLNEPQGGSPVMELLTSALQMNPDTVRAVGDAIRGRQQPTVQRVFVAPQQPRQLPPQQQQQQPRPQAAPQAPVAPVAPTAPAAPPAPAAPSAPTEPAPAAVIEIEQARQRTEQRMGKVPPLPQGAADKINKITFAARGDAFESPAHKEAAIVEAFIEFLMFLGDDPQWQPMVMKLLTIFQQGNHERSIEFVKAMVDALVMTGLLLEDVGEIVLVTLRNNIDLIFAHTGGTNQAPAAPQVAQPESSEPESESDEGDESESEEGSEEPTDELEALADLDAPTP